MPAAEWKTSLDAVRHHGGALRALVEGAAEAVLPTWERVVELFHASTGMPMVFLKQFRTADGTDAACYQAIVEATVRVTGGLAGGPVLRRYDIALLRGFSHRIAGTLGLATTADGEHDVVRSLAAGWMEFAATVEPGTVTWQAPT